jgi:hypothetical protein
LTSGRLSTLAKELGRDIAVEQPIPVFAEYGRIPHRVVHRQPDKPAEQQIVVELLHQLPLRAHCIKRLQQQRSQQSLRRDRRSAIPRVKLVEIPRQSRQRFIGQRADRAQRMIRGNAPLQRNIAEKTFRPLIFPAHGVPQSKGINPMYRITLQTPRESTFSAAC